MAESENTKFEIGPRYKVYFLSFLINKLLT